MSELQAGALAVSEQPQSVTVQAFELRRRQTDCVLSTIDLKPKAFDAVKRGPNDLGLFHHQTGRFDGSDVI